MGDGRGLLWPSSIDNGSGVVTVGEGGGSG